MKISARADKGPHSAKPTKQSHEIKAETGNERGQVVRQTSKFSVLNPNISQHCKWSWPRRCSLNPILSWKGERPQMTTQPASRPNRTVHPANAARCASSFGSCPKPNRTVFIRLTFPSTGRLSRDSASGSKASYLLDFCFRL